MKMEMMMKANGNLHSAPLHQNLLEAVVSAKAETVALKKELDVAKFSQQIAETLLKDIVTERNHLRQLLSEITRDSSSKLRHLSAELETCKMRELASIEEIKRLSSLINLERIKFQRQLHETKFFENLVIQGSSLGYNSREDLVNYQHTLVDGLQIEVIHTPLANGMAIDLKDDIKKTTQTMEAPQTRVKNKMLDSQNDTIRDLKSVIADLKKCLTEKSTAMEALELDFTRRLQEAADQVHALQNEVAEQDVILSELEEELQGQKEAKTAAEHAKSALQKNLTEKDDMLRYVKGEIEHVKDLYESRERSLTIERDKAMENLQLVTRDKAAMQYECKELIEQKKVLEEREQKLTEALDNRSKETSELLIKVTSMTATLSAQTVAQEKMKDLYTLKVNQLCKALEEFRDMDI